MRFGELRRLGTAALVVGTALAVVAYGEPALAKSSLGIGSAEVTAAPGNGILSGLFTQIAVWQREFFTALRHALVALKSDDGALVFLVGLSFAYGVFHAAGPGHGKAVISSYMLASRAQLKRGIALSFLSSLAQAVTALLTVGGGWYLLRGTAISMTDATNALEIASYALVALFGAVLLVRAVVKLARLPAARSSLQRLRAAFPQRIDDRSGAMGMLAFSAAASPSRPMMPAARAVAVDAVCDRSEDECGCRRAHMPSPDALAAPLTLKSSLAAILAIGLRPCSGAIVVLTFALLNGLYLGGVLSVLAMALGTAMTVSAIAALTVFGRGLIERTGRAGGVAPLVIGGLEIAGALLLLLLGIGLLGGALVTT